MNYLTIGIHYPNPQHKQDILDVASKVANLAMQQPGIIEAGAWMDPDNDRIVMMSLWKTQQDAMNASPILRPIIQAAPLEVWERQPSDNFLNLTRAA